MLALIEITDYIKRLLGEKNYVKSVFIDFKKAFDTVDYEILLYKLESYGIRGLVNDFFRSCAKETMSKLQIMQNKLLELLLKWDRRISTDLVHKELSLLKIDDVHIAKVLSFVNECRSCRVPDMFVNYLKTRESRLNLRNQSSLDIPWARTDMGLSRFDIKGARLLNQHLQTTNQLLYKKSFHKQLSNALIRTYN